MINYFLEGYQDYINFYCLSLWDTYSLYIAFITLLFFFCIKNNFSFNPLLYKFKNLRWQDNKQTYLYQVFAIIIWYKLLFVCYHPRTASSTPEQIFFDSAHLHSNTAAILSTEIRTIDYDSATWILLRSEKNVIAACQRSKCSKTVFVFVTFGIRKKRFSG